MAIKRYSATKIRTLYILVYHYCIINIRPYKTTPITDLVTCYFTYDVCLTGHFSQLQIGSQIILKANNFENCCNMTYPVIQSTPKSSGGSTLRPGGTAPPNLAQAPLPPIFSA